MEFAGPSFLSVQQMPSRTQGALVCTSNTTSHLTLWVSDSLNSGSMNSLQLITGIIVSSKLNTSKVPSRMLSVYHKRISVAVKHGKYY